MEPAQKILLENIWTDSTPLAQTQILGALAFPASFGLSL